VRKGKEETGPVRYGQKWGIALFKGAGRIGEFLN